MNTKEACNKLGLTQKGLRVYEEKGLVIPKRKENGYRDYSDKDLLKLREIMLFKDLGFSLEEIKTLLDKNIDDEDNFARSLYFQKQAISKKILALRNIEKTLKDSLEDILNDNSNNEVHFDTMERVLEKNKRLMVNWVDQWNFDAWARKYDESIHSNNDELKLFEDYHVVMGEVRKEIDTTNPESILDLGCGTGNLTGLYADKCDVFGIDQSLEMLLQCKKKYPHMSLKLGNFLDATYINGVRFDCIATTFAYHHLTQGEKEKAIDNMLESLKPHGKIVIGDLMFLNESKREAKRKEYISMGREDLWEIVEEEFYGDVEKLKKYVEKKGVKFQYKHLVNFTWLIVIGG
ncbi:MerR family transcriptional regulator [Alkalicella caledoniensis]|uniref:MerR family transcriptional regulator n=1 Tax=Alkalicella caledoniensis TaxID=2731377 RepID=A0A7G9W8Q4_ALKCA|nr:MerR family transcriptional regulator [Alkalicella caledoniensis]QNO15066.1 MerR family transcriptional regulator [Alkalicella caledoniensis]